MRRLPEVKDKWIPYYYEAERASLFVIMAAEDLAKSIATHPLVEGSPFPHPWEHTRFWYSVQSLLVAAGMLSKLLFPKEKHAERGKQLRKLLQVPDDSPLQSRRLRNVFEHFDEHLDDLDVPEEVPYMDLFVDPHLLVKKDETVLYGRAFYSETWTMRYGEEWYELRPIIQAAKEIHEVISHNPDVWWA